MPPRHHYWTIILEGKPTAFRAHLQEELLPTLRQLQVRHPDAVMKWFARGRLWESQDQERAEALARRRPAGQPSGDRRPRDWRPGGEHKDPRDRFKVPRDEKRRRFAEKLRRDWRSPAEQGERASRPDHPLQGDGAKQPPHFARAPRSDRGGTPPSPRGDSQRGGEGPWRRERPAPGRPPGQPGDRRPTPHGKSTGYRPSSGRPPHRGGGRPPGSGGRFGPRPQGGRKPGGGGRKGGGGGGR